MKKNVACSLIVIFALLPFFSFSQVPSVKWQKSLGGTSEDANYEDTSIRNIKKTPIVADNKG